MYKLKNIKLNHVSNELFLLELNYLCVVKRLIASFLIILQLALQVGIPIHKHFCEMDGAFASVLVKVDHQCNESHTDLPPCCQEEQTAACDANLQEKDCCSDELQVVKANFDQAYSTFDWQSVPLVYTLLPAGSNVIFFKALQAEHTLNKGLHYRPPPLFMRGKQIQLKNQVWQI
jgi:hypothetical protein